MANAAMIAVLSFGTQLAATAGNVEGNIEDNLDTTRRWAEEELTLFVCDAGDPAQFEELLFATALAASTWNGLAAGPRIDVAGTGRCDEVVAFDGINTVGILHGDWPFQASACASTGAWRARNSGEIVEADIAINPRHELTLHQAAGDNTFDLWSVLTHEIGHVLGLPDISDDPEATMYYLVNRDEVQKRSVSNTDETMLAVLYDAEPPPAGCSSTGQARGDVVLAIGLVWWLLSRRRSHPATLRLLLSVAVCAPLAASLGCGASSERLAPRPVLTLADPPASLASAEQAENVDAAIRLEVLLDAEDTSRWRGAHLRILAPQQDGPHSMDVPLHNGRGVAAIDTNRLVGIEEFVVIAYAVDADGLAVATSRTLRMPRARAEALWRVAPTRLPSAP